MQLKIPVQKVPAKGVIFLGRFETFTYRNNGTQEEAEKLQRKLRQRQKQIEFQQRLKQKQANSPGNKSYCCPHPKDGER